ncbi:hypothetical protein [Flexithrix dorotheae]|uniref:hypothetical protein n=1 Tax=Flexithrix dorotheae TaxID=70993 RepID=UPI0003616C1D|nr:hypothetical protein [Flexithrix dorotheae]
MKALKITQEDIIKYIYGEVSGKEKKMIEDAIFSNPKLEESFYNYLDMKNQVDQVGEKTKPSDKAIKNIMDFAKSFGKEKV